MMIQPLFFVPDQRHSMHNLRGVVVRLGRTSSLQLV